MNITATSEQSAQVISAWRVYSGSYWWEIRVVGWISQDKSTLRTTLYQKWQVGAYNYWPYWNDAHTYTISGNGQSRSCTFALQQDRSNTYKDKSSVITMLFGHDSSTGACNSNLRYQGYKCWEAFDTTVNIVFPNITIPEPSPDPEPPEPEDGDSVPYTNDFDPKYYILADDEIIYSLTDEEYYVIGPKLSLELNQIDNLTFSIPPNHALYSMLNKLKTTVEVKQGTETLFRGRILHDDIDFYNQKEVYCEGALSFLGDTIMPPYSEETYKTAKDFFKAAIDKHSELVPSSTPKRKLRYVRCNVSANITVSNEEYSSTSDVMSTLLGDVGGYLKLEYYEDGTTGISYLNSNDHTSSQVIDFGENLLDLTQYIDASDIYTSVVCLGKKNDNTGQRLTTGSGSAMYVEDAESIATYGRIIRIFTYDDIENQTELRNMATYLLALGIQQAVTIEIKAIDLHILYPDVEKIRIGDYVRVRSTPHKIDSYFQCSRIEMDLQNPENTVYTFGATIKALTDTTSKK